MKNKLVKKGIVIGIIFLFIGMSSASSVSNTVEKTTNPAAFDGNTLYVGGNGPNNYTTIQSAIDVAVDSDTVFVYDDSSPYYENIEIDKSINLVGENKDTTIIDGGGIGDVVYVSDDWVNITGFTIQNSESHACGIRTYSNFNCFSYNNILYNLHGIYLGSSSNNNTITGNNASYNNNGIRLSESNSNTITGNTANSNRHAGIPVKGSHSNTITGNNVSNNDLGINLGLSSTYNMIIGNNVSNNDNGIYLSYYSNNNMITGNNVTSNDHVGIYLDYSSSNTLMGNNVSNNDYGISLWKSNNNLLYHNNLINNSFTNAFDNKINIWYNSTLQEGNYYDDYTGVDDDCDGIGDTPYNIFPGDNQDNFPFMNPIGWVNSYLCCSGNLDWVDVSPGGTVTGSFDVGNIGGISSTLNWEIAEEPTWGTWIFTPDSGTLAFGVWETVDVEVVAPDDPESEFTGTVKIVNVDDPSDYCEISVILRTPVSQPQSQQGGQLLQKVLQQFPNAFPLLRQLLGL